jgi:DNA repair protein RecN (Recombination protein N)
MLSSLQVENFALIDELSIEFGEGLNVLTGTTGAGKSIIIGALDLILGGRGSEEIIRTGESAAIIEATFRNPNKEFSKLIKDNYDIALNDASSVVLRREYKRKGGGRAFIEGFQIPITALKEISENLADILGQHSHQALLNPDTHSGYLDHFAGIETEIATLRQLYNQTVELRDNLQASDKIAREISDRIDLLSYQVSEIEKAGLKIGEEESLKEEKKLLENSQKFRETANSVIGALLEDDGSSIEKIGLAEKSLSQIVSISDAVKVIIGSLRGASDSLREAVIDLQNLSERIADDPMRLEEVNERLDEIFRLRNKYGASIADILKFADDSKSELAKLKNRELDTQNIKERFDKSLAELNEQARKVSDFRKKARPALEKIVTEKLIQMGIPGAQFVIEINQAESESGLYNYGEKHFSGDAFGFDIVEFQFCANPGEGLKPLARIASGGEISRVMLALKNAFLKKKGGTTEVFDEIDVGISGDVAAKVARQLRELSKKHQVICITHLAQIASLADQHYRVYKSSQKGRSVTRVSRLDDNERVKEIATLISGEKVSPKALAGAQELLRAAREDT